MLNVVLEKELYTQYSRLLTRFKRILDFKDEKDKIVFRNIFYSFFIKGLNVLVNLLTIPLVLSFLSPTQYGIWLTLTAILSWFSLFDLGFGNGLRNHLTTAIAKGNSRDAKTYVSTTYAALTCIFGSVAILFFIGNSFIDWNSVFNAPISMSADLRYAVLYSISFLFLQFVLRLINTILLAYQRSAMANLTNAIIQVFVLAGLYIVKGLNYHTLTAVSIVYSIIPVFVLIAFSLVLFSNEYKLIRPSIKFVRFKFARGLLSVGINFFVIQIAALVIYASDNFIITQLFSPSDVTTYNIAYKYFSICNILFTIILAPFWSMTTKAYSEMDYSWIKNTMNKLFRFWLLLAVVLVSQLVVADWVYKIWTHSEVVVPFPLTIVMCLYFLIFTWGSIFSNFLNGVGKIRLQLYFSTASMFLNIPLAFVFIKGFHLGLIGIPMATIVVTSAASLISYIQFKKLVNLSATGVWNR